MFVVLALLMACAGLGCTVVVFFARERSSQKLGAFMAALFFVAAMACAALNLMTGGR